MLIQINCTEFNSRDLGSLILTMIVQLQTKLRSPFEILLQTGTGAQGSHTLLAG